MATKVELQGTDAERPSSPARTSHPVASVRPSTKYVEVEGPNKRFLRQALAPPRPVLPRKQVRVHSPPTGLRERVPLLSSLTGTGRAGKTGKLVCGGGIFKGEVLAGQPNGKGQFFISQVGVRGQQLQYDGEWVRGMREGCGTCLYYNGETYQGQWISNQRHGQGRMQYSNGDAYEGLWIKDHRNGLAKYFYANGDVFVGRYEHNRREGLGTIYMIRKGKKHTAEYKADRPLCGTWAEIDEECLAPMDDFLRASLPATVAPVVMTHLPELDVSQPDKVLQEVLSPLRCKPQKQLTLIKALRQQMSDFDEFELERLRHAFVRLSGGDSRVARLTPEKIRAQQGTS
ncbi:TPA: hypothetical protein ACH3X1_003733 [Trebouxia sp. C0004]